MRLIDADVLIGAIRHDVDQTTDYNWGYGLNHAIAIVRSQPTVDAVPVVRCKNCKYCDKRNCADGYGWCNRNGEGHGTTDDFFCADGERKL